jgi:hypothetical protein
MRCSTCFAALLVVACAAALCGGCKSAAEEAAQPTPAQTVSGAKRVVSPEAAKAAEAALRREKRGY